MIAKKILDRLQTEIGEVITYPPVETILQQELSNTIEEILTSPKYGIDMEAPLDYLKIVLNENILNFFTDFSYISKLDKYTQLFIRQVNEWENVDISSIETIKKLYDVVHSKNSKESCLQEIKELAGEYLNEMAQEGEDKSIIYLYMNDLLQQLEDEDRNDIDTDEQGFIVQLHKRLTGIWQDRTPEYTKRIGKDISVSDYRM